MRRTSEDRFKLPDLDLTPFENVDLKSISSWSQVELWCAVSGVEADSRVFKFFLCGIPLLDSVEKMMFEAVALSDSCDRFLDDVEVIEFLVAMFEDRGKAYWSSAVVKQWYHLFDGDYAILRDEAEEKKNAYKLLEAIDKKAPMLLIKYYDKHKTLVHRFAKELKAFIFRKTFQKAKHNKTFAEIYDVMLKYDKQYDNLNMFLQ